MDPSCRPCSEPIRPVSAVTVAVVVLIVVVIIYYFTGWLGHTARETFVSQKAREVFSRSRDLFERTRGAATFSEYKASVPEGDAVVYTDIRDLWKHGKLSPESTQSVL